MNNLEGGFGEIYNREREYSAVRHDPIADKALWVVFKNKAVPQVFESEKANRPINKDVVYIEIHTPGGKDVVIRKATEMDKKRFPDQYQRFVDVNTVGTEGTPLEELTFLPESRRHEYKAIKVFTAEQLANLTDGQLQFAGMGAREDRAKAAAYLDAAKESAGESALAAENERLKADIELLKEQVASIQKQALAPAKPKRGRPKKKNDEMEQLLEDLENEETI